MKENDNLQLIDPEMITHVAGLDANGLWLLMLERLHELRRLERFDSPALYGLRHGMENFEKCFWRFHEEDPDRTRWGLMHDLGFLGKPLRMDPWAASGYLDDASSADVLTSRDLIPVFDEESEANVYTAAFDILDAEHLDLIAASLRRFQNLGLTDEPATGLQVKTMAKTIRQHPTLRAAYIYHA